MNLQQEKILILDFGSQTTQLIARRIREQKVYCEIHPYSMGLDRIKEMAPLGIVMSGGPASVYDDDAPVSDPRIFDLDIPVLGICYGAQLMTRQLGGQDCVELYGASIGPHEGAAPGQRYGLQGPEDVAVEHPEGAWERGRPYGHVDHLIQALEAETAPVRGQEVDPVVAGELGDPPEEPLVCL